jgi:hypothetical protein
MKNVLFFITLICYTVGLNAQGVYTMPFLTFDPSPKLNGMAGVFTALPTDDVYGSYYNPAQIGVFSSKNNFTVGFFPQKTDWLPGANRGDLTFHANAFAAGYKLKTEHPFNLGFGYIYSKFDLGKNVWTDASGNVIGKFNTYETCNAFTFGLGSEYFLQYYLGLTYKSVYSKLVPIQIENNDGIADVSAFDFGMLILAPISKFIFTDDLQNINNISPFLDISLGYSLHNVGGKVIYGDADQADPLPRQARLGYGISVGVDHLFRQEKLKIIQFDFSTETRDYLPYRDKGNIKYKNILGDIKLFKNVFGGYITDEVVLYRGWRIELFNTFTYSIGNIKGDVFLRYDESKGYAFNTKGILNWLKYITENNDIGYIAEHFSLEYAWMQYESESEMLDKTTYRAIQIHIFGYW